MKVSRANPATKRPTSRFVSRCTRRLQRNRRTTATSPPGGSAVSGVALYRGQNFPSSYNGALFFADYAQGWIKVMMAGGNGLPESLHRLDLRPCGCSGGDLQVGPGGELFYVDIVAGTVRMINISPRTGRRPPCCRRTSRPGPCPSLSSSTVRVD